MSSNIHRLKRSHFGRDEYGFSQKLDAHLASKVFLRAFSTFSWDRQDRMYVVDLGQPSQIRPGATAVDVDTADNMASTVGLAGVQSMSHLGVLFGTGLRHRGGRAVGKTLCTLFIRGYSNPSCADFSYLVIPFETMAGIVLFRIFSEIGYTKPGRLALFISFLHYSSYEFHRRDDVIGVLTMDFL